MERNYITLEGIVDEQAIEIQELKAHIKEQIIIGDYPLTTRSVTKLLQTQKGDTRVPKYPQSIIPEGGCKMISLFKKFKQFIKRKLAEFVYPEIKKILSANIKKLESEG